MQTRQARQKSGVFMIDHRVLEGFTRGTLSVY